jgi:tetraacyldisaccharide 4'-kinase
VSILSGLYGRAAQLRRAWYGRRPHRTRHLDQPVVSVGNLTLGGSGKTPVVATLARLLSEAGERPAILSRGYGRREAVDGVLIVGDGRSVLEPAARSGDEPQMLARALPGVPVLVSPARHLAGRIAERRFGCTVHILDDGFQHVQLGRDVDLLLVAKTDLDDRVLPWGRLREPVDAARAADALLVTGPIEDAEEVAAVIGVRDVFQVIPSYGTPRLVDPFGAPCPADAGRRVLAVAGIARPGRFFAALRAEGWDVVREMVFRDHRWFTARDHEAIRRAAVEARADVIITTEKDAMRLTTHARESSLSGPPGGVAPWAYLPMEVIVGPVDRFTAWIVEQLSAARRRRAIGVA